MRMIAHDIAVGMERIQSFEMIHRDLKPANILLNKATPENNGGNAHRQYIVKIADFGYARRDTNDSVRKSVVGTPAYLAPELIGQTKSYEVTKATDVYSYGVVRIFLFARIVFFFCVKLLFRNLPPLPNETMVFLF